MANTDFSLRHDAVGPETFGGLMVPANGTSSGDVLTSQGDGQPAQWAAGGGGLPAGWTEAGDPAVVQTNGGSLNANAGALQNDAALFAPDSGSQIGQVNDDLPDGVGLKTFGYTGTGNIAEWYDGDFNLVAWLEADGTPGGTLAP